MKVITYADLLAMNPCYAPSKFVHETWSGTVIDILDLEQVPVKDRLWVVLRPEYLSDKLMRLFAVWCAKRVSHLCQDERSLKAIEVAERYANGEATATELQAVWVAARDTVWVAAWDAAWVAARAAARDAARSAAADAAWVAARGAARSAAADTVWDAAWDAEGKAQVQQLRKMILEEIKL